MGEDIIKQQEVGLDAVEVQAIRKARAGVVQAVERLVQLTQHSNPSQARQAIELLLKFGLADRQQQIDMKGGTIAGAQQNFTVNINKVDVKLLEVIDHMPPHIKAKAAQLFAEIEEYATNSDMDIFEGAVIEQKTCKCGCGQSIAEDKTWVRGHHLKKHVAEGKIKEQRERFKEEKQRGK